MYIYICHDHFIFLRKFQQKLYQSNMCALAPFPISNWPLVNPIGYDENYMYEGSESIESFLQFPPPQEEILLDCQSPASFTQTSLDPCRFKKLNHSASERDRRKKVNSLYSSLRSLLPVADQMVLINYIFINILLIQRPCLMISICN